MISFFRRALSSWLVLGLLGLILIAFIITGVGGPSAGRLVGPSGDSIATVGSTRIGMADAAMAVRRQLQNAQQQNPSLDMTTFVAGRGVEQTVDQLIASKALEVFGEQQGMVAGRRLVDGEIASIPGLKGPSGKVERASLQGLLAQQHMNESQLREAIAGDIIRRQLLFPIASGSRVPTGLVLPYASLLLESREGLIGIVPAKAMGGGTPPGEAEVAAFYKRNLAAYTLPERRVLSYAVIGRDQVAAKAAPSEASIAAAYKAGAAKFAPHEIRDLSQVVLDSEAKARAFAAKMAGGTSFAKAAADAGFGPSDTKVGRKTQAEFATLASPAVAQAAFAVGRGSVSAPAKSGFGWHIVRIDGVEAVPGKTLAQAHDEIAAALGKQKGAMLLSDLVAAVDDAIGDGSTFDDVVKDHGLEVVTTPPLLANGRAPEAPTWQAPPEVAPLLKAAFDTSPDEDPTVETVVPDQRYAVLRVARILPSAPLSLAQVHDRVLADLAAQRAQQRAKAVATGIVAKANAGVPLATAFAEAKAGLPPPQKAGGKRADLAGASKNGRVPPPLVMLFSLRQGATRLLEAPHGQGWFVIQVNRVVSGDARTAPSLIASARADFGRFIGEEYAEQFAHAAQAAVGARRNDQAVARLKAQVGGSDAQ